MNDTSDYEPTHTICYGPVEVCNLRHLVADVIWGQIINVSNGTHEDIYEFQTTQCISANKVTIRTENKRRGERIRSDEVQISNLRVL